jgi:DNA-binding winged helix-turn-helix (wHTH) protein
MPSDLLAAARVFQIPGPASPQPGPASSSPAGAARRSAGQAVPVPAMRAVGSVLPEGTLLPEEDRPEVTLPAGLDSLTGPDGPLDPSSPGTLLAVVPIPGTDSSLAIVGYTVPAAAPRDLVQASRRTGRGLVVDHARRCVWLSGQEVQLTYQEFELLAFLSANPAQVFSRADLLERVWGQRENSHHQTRTVDVHVSRLRRKLGPGFGQCLTTEHRVGYRFDPAMEISA